MRLRPFDKCSQLSTTSITIMSCTEVGTTSQLHTQRANTPPDLKPENLLYLSSDPDSSLVLADFGIAKMLDSKNEVLTTMAGSFGYAAPEVMLKKGHGKPVDMWSMGVITYTLLCGYSPFRSENLADLIEECKNGRVIFHERYWKDVSKDAKEFITLLLQPDPAKRPTSEVRREEVLYSYDRWLTQPIGGSQAYLAQRQDCFRPQLVARNPRLRCEGTTQAWYRTRQAGKPYRSPQDARRRGRRGARRFRCARKCSRGCR